MAEKNKTSNSPLPSKYLWKSPVAITLVSLSVLSVAGFSWAFINFQKTQKQLEELSDIEGQKKVAQKEVKAVTESLSELILLPEEEEPIVATVKEAETLRKKEAFYKNVQEGDKVVIFSQARKAMIYRPKENRLINVGPIVMGDQTNASLPGEENLSLEGGLNSNNNALQASRNDTEEQGEDSVVDKISLEIRNGSLQSGAANLLAEKLKEDSRYQVTAWGNAQGSDYQKTLVVDLSTEESGGQFLITKLAQELEAEIVTELPEGESPSQAETLVIIGADFQ
jgi:hypothetical protein